MRTVACLAQFKGHAPRDDFLAEIDKGADDLLQVQHLGASAIDGEYVAAEGALQRGVFEQLVQDDFRLMVALDLDHHTHPVAVRLIVGAGHAFDDLVFGQLYNSLDQTGFVDLIG